MEAKAGMIPNKYGLFNMEQGMNQLLSEVGQIVQSNRIRRAEEKKRGETFNIFEILGLQTKETILHSSFIASLFNPDGSHGLSYKPLELFLRKLKDEGILKFEIDFSQVDIEIEYSIGNITSDNSEGGRMDILLNDGKNFIGIENKIDAGDQNTQMVRYHNFLLKKKEEKKGDSLLLYLSKFGSSPGEDSINCPDSGMQLEPGKDFYVISYKDFILNWLEECRHFAIDNVKVREIIKQYQETIKNITGMNYTDKEKEILLEILMRHVPAVNSIIGHRKDFLDYLFMKKIVEPMKKWASTRDLICEEGSKIYDGEGGPFGLSFYKKDWRTKMIRIESAVKDIEYSDTLIGICWKEEKGNEENSKIIPGYYKTTSIFPNGFKFLEKKYKNVKLEDLEDDSTVTKILKHYQKEIENLLESIEEDLAIYNM